jgi:sugar phosphate isomerase/epimerase
LFGVILRSALESKRERGGNTVEETIKIREQETDAGLTTADLANAGKPLGVRIAPTSGFRVSSGSSAGAATATALEEEAAPLFSAEEAKDFRGRWDAVQVGFVDEPRRAVVQADSLVAAAMKRLAEMFAAERAKLEGQWSRGDDVSTEDLRLALRRYRSFFGRILSV